MVQRTRGRRSIAGIAASALAVCGLGAHAQEEAEESAIEEMVVTGSYIKRKDSFDTANPLNIVDAVDIAEAGVPNMGDIIRNQTFNYGTVFVTNTTARIYQEGLASEANLRGLGSGATLTLVNGRRTLTQNVNNLLPQIAIGRIETVKDGASALYGSDAVAGVVNFLPDTNFEGLDIQLYGLTPRDSTGDYGEDQWQVKLGGGNDRTHMVTAFEYRKRGNLKWRDRPDFNNLQYGSSATGNPGTWAVPVRSIDADGNVVSTGPLLSAGAQRLADPGCGIDNGPGGTDINKQTNHQSGRLAENGTRCRLEFGEFWDFSTELDHFTGWALGRHDINDYVTFEAEMGFSRSHAFGRGSPSNPGGRFSELGTIPGDLPGNPWRAFVDKNGNGAIDPGEHLFAEQAVDGAGEPLFDRFGTPIPARDSTGDGFAEVGAHGDPANTVVLARAPFDLYSGVPFNEDVLPVGFRLVGKQGPLPSGHNADGSGAAATSGTDFYWQWRGGTRFTVPDSSWSGEFFYTHQRHGRSDPENQAESFSAVVDGLNGLLGPSNTDYFNMFSTRAHPCVDRVCNPNIDAMPGDPGYNTQFVIDEISFQDDIEAEDIFNVIDAVVTTSDLYQLPAGPIGLAIGAQWRRMHILGDQGPIANACDRWVNACAYDFDEARTTHASFLELAVPILDMETLGTLDAQIAVRSEDSGGSLKSTDPKIGLRWQPLDWAAFRASWGTSFVAPSLGVLHVRTASFLRPMQDRSCELSPDCEVEAGTFRTETFSGNPDLSAEVSTAINLGISLSLLDDSLTLSLDATEFDFTDRIARISGPQVIDQDFARFQEFVAGGGARAQWIAPRRGSGSGETDRIRRNAAGEIIEVFTSSVNADSMLWRGLDFGATYRFGFDGWGSFTANLTGTWVDTFSYQLTGQSNCLSGNGGPPPCEAAGARNDRVPVVPPIPALRVNGRLGWVFGRHSATMLGRYFDDVIEDSGDPRNDPEIPGDIIFDASYTYNFDSLFGSAKSASVTLGGINIFNTLPEPIYTFGGIETLLYDPRGGLWYGRFNVSL